MLPVALVALHLAAGPQAASANEQVVELIPYVTCDDSRWRASLNGDQFMHYPRDPDGRRVEHPDVIIHYKTWGGVCWEARWNRQDRVFQHRPVAGGAGHPDTILNFEDWEGVRWTARREGDDWIVRRP